MHNYCTLKCFQKAFGQASNRCKYGFPYNVPQKPKNWMRRILVTCALGDMRKTRWNACGLGQNVRRWVSGHGLEMYLATSKPETTTTSILSLKNSWGAAGAPKLELLANIYFMPMSFMSFSTTLSGRVIPGCTTRK